MRKILLSLLLFICSHSLIGQDFPYQIRIDSMEIPTLGGLQSYAFGQANGKWLIIGGRLDGLHQRQPFAAFDVAGHNIQLLVVDPITKEKWVAPLTSLSSDMQEQLSSTNMQFIQRGDILILTGGYGFSAKADDHKTFPFITFVDVPAVIKAVTESADFVSYFKQYSDEEFAVAGGQLQTVDGIFFLVGGHRFEGRYNPNDMPTFEQTYSNQIRKFTVTEDSSGFTVNHLGSITSKEYLHRRDFNVLPQILPNGEQGLIAFSGVFQEDVDQPYLNAVVIDADSFRVDPKFAQYYNHYHCANISMYDEQNNIMHNLFFGGIAQYYDSSGFLVQDNDVPFVKTIARVSRGSGGWMQEFKLDAAMPAYLGAASEFIFLPTLPMYDNEVVKLNDLKSDSVLLGYIYGGIKSSAANVFWINTGIESNASRMIYPVYLIKSGEFGDDLNEQSINAIQLQIFPNPSESEVILSFNMPKEGNVVIEIKNMMGEIAYERTLKRLPAGNFTRPIKFRDLDRGDVYYLHLTIDGETVTQKMLVH